MHGGKKRHCEVYKSMADQPAKTEEKKPRAKTQTQLKREQEAATLAKELREALHSKDLGRSLLLLETLQDGDFQLTLRANTHN